MADDLMTKIQDAVRAALPAHLSDELQKVLKEAADNKNTLEWVNKQHKEVVKERDSLKSQLEMHLDLNKRLADYAKRDVELTKREMKMDLLEFKVQAATQRCDDAKEIVKAVFQNNTFKYNRVSSETGYNSGGSVNKSLSDNIHTEGG